MKIPSNMTPLEYLQQCPLEEFNPGVYAMMSWINLRAQYEEDLQKALRVADDRSEKLEMRCLHMGRAQAIEVFQKLAEHICDSAEARMRQQTGPRLVPRPGL